ncbi:MAG: heme ABC transporter substrate-binding protein IsdE [bacterium]|nr:heme ABC transporter substrate-binding protein IsdE [bacterium]
MTRRKITAACLMVSFLLSGCAVNKQPEQTADETPKTVQSIAATSVATLQILDQMGVENVVGIPKTASELPERYKGATEIGAPMAPDLEVLKTVNPTLVLSPVSLKNDLSPKYEAANLSSYFVNLNSVQGMYDSIKELGTTLDKKTEADQLVSEYEAWLSEKQKNQESLEKKNVLILMGLPGSYVVATENSYIGNLVALAGGVNCYEGTSTEDFINVNTEDMLEKKPDIIIRTSHALPDQVMEMFKKEFAENDIWKHFEAVKNNQVYDLTSTDFGMSANLNYVAAVEELEGYLYSNK